MSNKAAVPDAWDDDWEASADVRLPEGDNFTSCGSLIIIQKVIAQPLQNDPPAKVSKSQRRAQHKEQQRQLWDSAENPDRFHWLEAQGVVPLKNEFKPQVTLLSRKPGAPIIAKKSDGLANGVAGLSMNDDDDDDSEEESRKKRESELEERTRKAKIEREEKQKRYAEARERIMGSSSGTPGNGPSTAAARSRESSHGRENRRSRGNHRSGKGSSQPTSSTDQSPARPVGGVEKTLFDPDDMGRRVSKREVVVNAVREEHPFRQPKGPVRGGGFGFGSRGGKAIA